MKKILLGCLVIVVVAAVGWGQSKTDPTLDKLTAAFEAAYNAKDAAKVAAFYADDAVLMPPDLPMVKGRASIETYYKSEFTKPGGTLQLVPMESAVNGMRAHEVGTSTVTTGNPSSMLLTGVGGGGSVSRGKYVVLYVRVQSDWKISYDIFNRDAAAPPPPK